MKKRIKPPYSGRYMHVYMNDASLPLPIDKLQFGKVLVYLLVELRALCIEVGKARLEPRNLLRKLISGNRHIFDLNIEILTCGKRVAFFLDFVVGDDDRETVLCFLVEERINNLLNLKIA